MALDPRLAPLELETPEHQMQAILDAVPEDGMLLEYGMGGSTPWFASRLLPEQTMVSVEHDEAWYWKARNRVPNLEQVRTKLLPATNNRIVNLPYGHPAKEAPIGLASYVWGKEDRDDECPIEDADVIFVDGICRGAVIAVASQLMKDTAFVFLHDAQRPWYAWATNLLEQVELIHARDGEREQLLAKFRKPGRAR